MRLNSKSQFMIFQLATLILLLPLCPNCYADTNGSRHSNCDPPGAADENPSWTANLNSVLSSLKANASINNGYSVAEAGISPDKAYGLIQCRGDISPPECRECAGKAVRVANESCGKGNGAIIMETRCFLRYSDKSFYGVWEDSIFYSSGSNSTGSDDATVVAKGLAMMARLAAAAPMEALMFAKSERDDDDDGKGGKMYGLAQCTRDLERSDCGDCLDYLLKNTWTEITNKRTWESFVRGCFMVYDHRFNSSRSVDPPSPANANRIWAGRFSVGITILTAAIAYL